jgi:hypothetical protein
LIVLAISIRLFFWAYTNRVWEDALISVQHSENAALGLGLTHDPSHEPPLHGFTSPLSVLVPLIGDLLHVGYGLAVIKMLSALLGGLAVFLGFEICIRLKLPPALALTVAAYLAFEHHQILWGMAGMETQITVFAYLYSFWCFQRRAQLEKGISLGLCLLARPDAILWAGLAFAFELHRALKSGDLKPIRPLITGLVGVYGPWLIFTFAYYGSPIPNTIYAKSLAQRSIASTIARDLALWHPSAAVGDAFRAVRHLFDPFSTLGLSYGGNGTGFQPLWDRNRILARCMASLSIPGLVAAVRRRDQNAGLIFAFLAVYLGYFTFLVPKVFEWYTPPFTAAAVIGCVYGLWYLVGRVPMPSLRTMIANGFAVAYTASIFIAMPITMRAEKHVQQYVEVENREAIGLYIRGLARSGDTIGCEPLGYIGYYSRLPVYDYPGLCNRKVVQFLREHPAKRDFLSMLQFFHPTFLVLRPWEAQSETGKPHAWIDRDYSLIRVFQVSPEKSRQLLFSDRNIDQKFYVFQRNTAPERNEARNAVKGGSLRPPR